MKITLEPSKKTPSYPGEAIDHTVIIESAEDDLNADDVAGLLRGAMIAYGFSPETVRKVMPEED